MSEQCFILVPVNAEYMPSPEQIEAARCYWNEISPTREGEELSRKATPRLRNASEIERVTCGACGTVLTVGMNPSPSDSTPSAWWSELMFVVEYNLAEGMPAMPCCSVEPNVDALLDSSQPKAVLSRFALGLREPSFNPFVELQPWEGRGNLLDVHLRRFQQILGCELKQLWQRA